jgi:hypothetical protein
LSGKISTSDIVDVILSPINRKNVGGVSHELIADANGSPICKATAA